MSPAPAPGRSHGRRWRRADLVIFGAVFIGALAFALYTQHAWEDYYITYRPSKNLATGQGLVFVPGERVHTFTSPFNVLIPAVLSVATGNTSDELVLWLFRLISIGALAGAAVVLYRTARHQGLSPPVAAALIGLFAADAKIVDFSINGQEIGLMMLFLALALSALLAPSRSPTVSLGLAWAGLMWTRPDGFVYAGMIALGVLLFNAADPAVANSRTAALKLFLRAGAIATALYLPWFLWAWSYYGSPIPNTVVAKGLRAAGTQPLELLGNLVAFPLTTLVRPTTLDTTFAPIYAANGGWPHEVLLYSRYLSWVGAFYWLLPWGRPQTRAASFAFMGAEFYLTHNGAYPAPWYLPNCAVLGIWALPKILQELLQAAKNRRLLTVSLGAVAGLVLTLSLGLTLAKAYQLRIQQHVIEDGHRRQIGLWLFEHAASTRETVFLEPLGYIGYFSQLRMYDFPGLSSPDVIAARRSLGDDRWDELVATLRPDWLVLRPAEAEGISRANPALLEESYMLVKTFDVSKQLEAYGWIPGRRYLTGDQTFLIFRRRPREGGAPR